MPADQQKLDSTMRQKKSMPVFEGFKEPTMKEINSSHTPSSEEYLSIYLVTWNVNGKDPDEESISDLFEFERATYDVYAISLQELPQTVIIWSDSWLNKLIEIFKQRHYILLKNERVSFTEVAVFVRKRDLLKYHHVESTYSRLKNGLSFKGGVGLRFYYKTIRISFLGCHLTPHDENFEQRLKDYRYLRQAIEFSSGEKFYHHDIAFLFGDLNFRLNPLNTIERDEFDYIVDFIAAHRNDQDDSRFVDLLKFDQIRYAQSSRKAFHDLEESPITFPPSFKFIHETNQYDRKRRPAWTDRILSMNNLKRLTHKANFDTNSIQEIKQSYRSLPNFMISDHKPVRELVWLPIGRMIQTKYGLAMKSRSFLNRNPATVFQTARFIVRSSFASPISQTDTSLKNSTNNPGLSSEYSSTSEDEQSLNESESNQEQQRRLVRRKRSSALVLLEDPVMQQKRFGVEFFHIPDWGQTRKFEAHFRIVDAETSQPVSLSTVSTRNFLSVWDYVGLFPENFDSLDSFLTYSYPNFGQRIQSEEACDALSLIKPQEQELNENVQQQPEQVSTSISNSIESSKSISSRQQVGSIELNKEELPSIDSNIFHEGDGFSSSLSSRSIQSISKENVFKLEDERDAGGGASSTSEENSSKTCDDLQNSSSTIETNVFSPSTTNNEDVISVRFDESSPIPAGNYVLIYFRANHDVLGISESFTIEHDLDLSSF